MANARDIIYTGLPLNNINVNPNTALDVILGLIDTAVGSGSGSSPDFTPWNLYCVTQIDGTSHPTNIEDFSKGISKVLCDFKTAYTAFTGTTYVTDQGMITSAINSLQAPAFTYAPFSIVDTDSITQVWNKSFTGFTGIINSIKPNTANWSLIGAATATSIVAAFNTLIAYELTQDATCSSKQPSLGTFNTSAIGGSTGVTPINTINALIAYAGTLPEYDSDSITWGCVAQGGTLQDDIDNIVVKLNANTANYIADTGTGLAKTNIGSCLGYRAAVDPTWVGLFKVAVDSSDASGGTAGYLGTKLISSDSTVDIAVSGTHVDLKVHTPIDGKVKVNSGGTAGFLADKITTPGSDWGLSIGASVVSDQLALTLNVSNPFLLVQNIFSTASQDPDLAAQLCALVANCSTCNCAAPTSFSVTVITV